MKKHLLLILTCFQILSCQNTNHNSQPIESVDDQKPNYQQKIDSLKSVEIELEKQKITYKALGKSEESIDSLTDLIWEVLDLSAHYKMKMNGEFPITMQTEANNCGPTCIKMISDYYGVYRKLSFYNELVELDSNGTTIDELVGAGRQLNFTSGKHIITYDQLLELNSFPLIVHWNSSHFIVVYEANQNTVWVADPLLGRQSYSRSDFCKQWVHLDGPAIGHGKAVTFVPQKEFHNQ